MKLSKSDLELETIVRRIGAGELDLQPDFQRGEVWDRKRRQRLIDTILRQWYVPAIHIVVNSDAEEEVLDGQQRLAAIRDFFADRLKVDGNIEPHDELVSSVDGATYSRLPDQVRREVNRFVLQIIKLSEYGPDEPNELFFRLNQAYNLTPPEKRNALHGRARDQVRQLVEELTSVGLLDRATIGFNNGRLAYDDIIARTCVALESGNLRHHINNSVVEDFYRSSAPFSDSTIESVRTSGNKLMRQITNSEDRIKFNKGTLQTWLIYCHWATNKFGELPDNLLSRFENHRSVIKQGRSIGGTQHDRAAAEVLRLYDNRASYRVTDVSSVLIRDLSVHVYSMLQFGTAPVKESDTLISKFGIDPSSAQTYVTEFLEDSNWGNPILWVESK